MTILRLHFQVTGHKQPILAVGGRGDLLASAEYGSIRLWSFGASHATTGGPALLQGFPCSRQPVRALFILPAIACGRRYPCYVVGVFEEDGVVLFNVRGRGVVDRHVLLHPGDKKDSKISTAAWNADTCSLAIASARGGVKIYDILPKYPVATTKTRSRSTTRDDLRQAAGTKGEGKQKPVRVTPISVTGPPPSRPAVIVLRHEIVIKTVSSTPGAGRSIVSRQVSSLATSSEDRGWWEESGAALRGRGVRGEKTAATAATAAGAGILVGVADGKHLCVWDLATGSTLLTALSMAPEGCTVERVLWHGPTALVALMYHDGIGVTRVDVHQLDVGKDATVPLLSYISDVLVAGASFTPGPTDHAADTPCPPWSSATPPYPKHQHHHRRSPLEPEKSSKNTSTTYLHIVDRLRTLRTWLLHPGGATAVSAYSLPAAAPRVPRNAAPFSEPAVSTHEHQGGHPNQTSGDDGADRAGGPGPPSNPVGPESSLPQAEGSPLLSCGDGGDRGLSGEGRGGEGDELQRRKQRRQPTESRRIIGGVDVDNGDRAEDEEMVHPGSLPAGALVAAVLPSRLRGHNAAARSGILVAAGVALSGLSFLPEEWECGEGQGSFLWESHAAEERFGNNSGREDRGRGQAPPRVLGMRALVPERGNQQALALVWAERPSFQVLDVSRDGRAGAVEHISLARRHREDQLATAPRYDRPCFLTSWCHSIALGVLLCGWNDGTVDVVNPMTGSLSFRLQSGRQRQQQEHRQQQLLPPGEACVPTTAVGLVPLSLLLPHAGNQFLSEAFPEDSSSDDNSGGVCGIVALVGSADGTLALWPTRGTLSRPWDVILAHTDAVIAIRTAMDAPRPELERFSEDEAAPFGKAHGCPEGDDGDSSFFVVTAGANREVKVWGIDAAERQDLPPLTLAGYTVVGSGVGCGGGDGGGGVKAGSGSGGNHGGCLTALELLSERHMACGFDSGAIEVWSIPFASRGRVLASTRQALQAFPRAHGARVTSINISLGVGFRPQSGARLKAGRVVLTTSVDRTVVRWVSMNPGDWIRPLNRYCLSEEPVAAVLLPPPAAIQPVLTTAASRQAGGSAPRNQLARIGVEISRSATAESAMIALIPNTSKTFRVVAALKGVVTVLELATIETLLGEGARYTGRHPQRLCAAVANAFPGAPLIARLPPRPAAFGLPPDQKRSRGDGSFRWRVGGPRGREAGWYDVLGGMNDSLAGWEAAGKRRMALTASSSDAWLAGAGGTNDDGVAADRVGGSSGGGVSDVTRQANSRSSGPGPETSKCAGRKGQREGRRAVKSHRSLCVRRRPFTVKLSEKTLTVCRATQGPGGRRVRTSGVAPDHDRCASTAPENAYRTFRGGKTIKVDPSFARAAAEAVAGAAWERLWLQSLPDDDSTTDHVPPRPAGSSGGAAPYGNQMYSMEMTVPEVSRTLSADVLRRGEDDFSGIAISFQGQPTGSLSGSECYSARFKHSPSSPPTVTEWPPSSTKAESVAPGFGMSVSELPEESQHTASAAESKTSEMAPGEHESFVEGERFVPTMTKTKKGLPPGDVAGVRVGVGAGGVGWGGGGGGAGDSGSSAANSRLARGTVSRLPEGGKERTGGERSAANSTQSDVTAMEEPRAMDAKRDGDDDGHEDRGKVGPMNAIVAATAAARHARDAWDARGRMKTPMLIERRRSPSVHESRFQFNFDSAQAPACGMSGVGVAVPKGYADERLRAAKRSYTPSLPLRKTARRRIDGAPKAHGGGVSSEQRGSAGLEAGGGQGQREPETAVTCRAEAFPTGLVVSTHFRESFTGREILMLEVEKAADRRHIHPGGASDQSRLPAFGVHAANETGAGGDVGMDEATAAPAAATELACLSPRSKKLQAVFESLAAGRDVLTQEALVKWEYVARSIERGLVSQYQVRSLFRQAHGGRHRGKMAWQDMVAFYEGMESALEKACAPPVIEDFVVDSEEWDSVSVSLYLTRRGEAYVVAIEAAAGDGCGDPPPSPMTVRRGEYTSGSGGGGGGCQGKRVTASWGTANVANPDVTARITLRGLSPERHYELYAYGENGVGGRIGKSIRAGGGDAGCDAGTGDKTCTFSVEPAPSGMSAELVAATRLSATTAREPDEDLDVPWKDLPESEKMTEALAALADPLVARAAREAALDAPTAEDLAGGRCEADPVSRNKWRSFCRWWPTAVSGGGSGGATGAAGGVSERSAFLLRECIFAAQQPEILEEAAMMGVQILEGDWNAEVAAAAAVAASGKDTRKTKNPSARQRRWTAFRSWYRGGRLFDRADQTLIAAAMLRRPPSPGSQGRPLTPRMTPADGPRPAAPFSTDKDGGTVAVDAHAATVAAVANSTAGEPVPVVAATEDTISDVAEGATAEPEAGPLTPPVGMTRGRRTTPPAPPAPPGAGAKVRVTLLKSEQPAPVRLSDNGGGDGGSAYETEGAIGDVHVHAEMVRDTDAAQLAGIEGWAAGEGVGDDTFVVVGGEVAISRLGPGVDGGGGSDADSRCGGVIAEGLPPVSRESGTAAAKRLRMEARRKFLAARTTSSKQAARKVGRLLDVKREDVKAKRAAEAASGVVARRGRAAAAKKKRRRSQVEKALALERADELLEGSGKAEELRQRRGSLGTLRPEDVASIGVFDTFDVDEFDPQEVDPELFRRRSSAMSDAEDTVGSLEKEAAAWAPRSPGELTLELQLACVHPRVCTLAASARVGVPDPEDAFSPLSNKKERWAKFSAWYYNPEATRVSPHRKAFLDGEVTAAMTDEIVRLGMESEGMLEDGGGEGIEGGRGCDLSDFLDWYCEEGAAPRQDFRRRRAEELLQSRRHTALQLLAYVPTPFLFCDLPRPIPPPPPPVVQRVRLFPSRSPEAFSWEDVSKWYGEEALGDEDETLRDGERAGQRAALLEVAREEEGENQSLERRVARWEDFRSALMRAAEAELRGDPFRVGEGEWQYSATLLSWRELKYLGFDTGSGLENKDEIHDALEVAQKEAQDERERVAEVRRQREVAKQMRLEEERRRREEEDRLRWMRETEERRRLVQQHMANLKRQRALERERAGMASEETLALALAREEKRLLLAHQAREVAKVKELRLLKMAAAAVTDMEEMVKKRLDVEADAMAHEDRHSREVELERLAADAVLRDREAYLRELYKPFVPLWADLWEEEEEEEEVGWSKDSGFQLLEGDKVEPLAGGEGNEILGREADIEDDFDLNQTSDGFEHIETARSGGIKQRPTMWWRGADAPHIWKGPPTPEAAKCRRAGRTNGKLTPGSRFVPAESALLDDLQPQAVSMGRLSREYLALLGLPYESVRGMFEQDSYTVKNVDAMVDGIQLGRVFTMFEKDEVRSHLVPIAPTIKSLGKFRQRSRTGGRERTRGRGRGRGGEGNGTASLPLPLNGSHLRLRTLQKVSREGASCFPWRNRSVGADDNSFPPAPRAGTPLPTGQERMVELREEKWQNNSNYSSNHRSLAQNDHRNLESVHNAEPSILATCSSSGGGRNGDSVGACGVGSIGNGAGDSERQLVGNGGRGVWLGQEGARQIVLAGVEAIAGLPLSGDERGRSATPRTATEPATSAASAAATSARPLARSPTSPRGEEATSPCGRLQRTQPRRPTPTPEASQPPARAADINKDGRRRGQTPTTGSGEFGPTHLPRRSERADSPAASGTDAAAGTGATASAASAAVVKLVRERAGNPTPDRSSVSARSPAAIPAPPEAREAGPVMPQQERARPRGNSQQWGGFGPGHVPKYFRGRFGVAGEKKALLRRRKGDGLGGDEGGNDNSG